MDIALCVDLLGLLGNQFRLNQSVPPHYITEWGGPDPQPTQEELEVVWAQHLAELNAKEYSRKRKAEYPSIDELIVALWEGVVEERMASVTALEGLRQAVKDKYPKSE
jgi:hypothetical protein